MMSEDKEILELKEKIEDLQDEVDELSSENVKLKQIIGDAFDYIDSAYDKLKEIKKI